MADSSQLLQSALSNTQNQTPFKVCAHSHQLLWQNIRHSIHPLTRVNRRRRELRNIFCHMWSDQESSNFCLHNLKIYCESLTGRYTFIIGNLTKAAVCDKLRMCWLIWVEGGGLYRSGVQKSNVWRFSEAFTEVPQQYQLAICSEWPIKALK